MRGTGVCNCDKLRVIDYRQKARHTVGEALDGIDLLRAV